VGSLQGCLVLLAFLALTGWLFYMAYLVVTSGAR
jgi:hypothetical protein